MRVASYHYVAPRYEMPEATVEEVLNIEDFEEVYNQLLRRFFTEPADIVGEE